MKLASSVLTDMDLMLEVGDGVIGALSLVKRLVMDGRRDIVEKMRDLGITGSAVWISYKDLGDQTLETLIANIESADIKDRLAKLGY